MQQREMLLKRLLVAALSAYLLTFSVVEFWDIAWGTGSWLGQFSLKWGLVFFAFVLFCLICFMGVVFMLWYPQRFTPFFGRLLTLRERSGIGRWILAIVILITPVWLLQYTDWGIVIHGQYLRVLIWAVSAILLACLLTGVKDKLLTWSGLLPALVLSAGVVVFASPFMNVTDYPFAQGWSEGNRLWDYSILFGRRLYDYPADKSIPVLLDLGRQFVGGIPFLLPGVTIWQVRLWVSLTNIIPYLILGLAAYRLPKKDFIYWMLAGIWAFTFVRQGLIHPPLLFCAIIVALVWRRSLWIAIPLIIVFSYFAEVSRYTWLFAPGMWAGMLELSGAVTQNGILSRKAWARAITVGLAGGFGGFLAPKYVPSIISWIASLGRQPNSEIVSGLGPGNEIVSNLGSGVSISSVSAEASAQPLLWYRLLPNATYGYGVLVGLLLAVVPLVAILMYLSSARHWVLNVWQRLALVLPLLAFLTVGLIVSTKIGGGGDLHNMDMFIIGLMFAGAVAWCNGGRKWIDRLNVSPAWVRFMIVIMIALPAFQFLLQFSPTSISGDLQWIMTLADIPSGSSLPDILPSEWDMQKALREIREAAELAAREGDVLFMDQRQLLTFGYIKGVPLVPEYDKKVLINQAMGGDPTVFDAFYKDLASHRFSLIITSPLRAHIQTESDDFGEENNAWVRWVSKPVLCYYKPLEIYKKVNVELLVPRQDPSSCAQPLP